MNWKDEWGEPDEDRKEDVPCREKQHVQMW